MMHRDAWVNIQTQQGLNKSAVKALQYEEIYRDNFMLYMMNTDEHFFLI